MPKLFELKERRSRLVGEMQGLVAGAEKETRDLNDGESQRFDELKGQVGTLDQQISRLEVVAELERRADATVIAGDQPLSQLEQRVSILAVMRSLMDPVNHPLQGAEREYSQEVARRSGQQPQGIFVPMALIEKRAPVLTTAAPELISLDHRPDLFSGMLRDQLVGNRLGVRTIGGLIGDVGIPRQDTATAVSWIAEGTNIPDTDATFASVTLSPKHVGGIVEFSRQLILQSSPDIEMLLRSDLARSVAIAIDKAMVSGGGGVAPIGILNTTGTLVGSLAGPTYAQVQGMIAQLETANVINAPKWLLSPKASLKLRTTEVVATTGVFIAQGGNVAEVPAISSGLVPETTTGTAILGDWSQVLVGTWAALDLMLNPYAEAAFRKANVLLRAVATVDVAVRDPGSFVIASNVTD